MATLEDKRILVTGPAGQIAFPLAARLAKDNEVWGIARFSDTSTRERCEDAGIRTAVVDLADPDWSKTPDDVDHVLHLAAVIVAGEDFDAAIRINALGTGHLMSRFRKARSCLVMSTCGVYAAPRDYSKPVIESDPLGGTPQPYAATYCVSKIAQEAVAQYAAEQFALPTTIARMNVAYGDNGGYPAILLEMILRDVPIPVLPDGHGQLATPIHEADIYAHTPDLLEAAAVPATIVNWGGDEPVSIPELAAYIAKRIGREAKVVESDDGIHQYWLDSTKRTRLTGRCEVSWQAGIDRMITARHEELQLR